jgi:hypothetical protein
MKTLAKLGLAALVAFAMAAPVVAEDAEVVTLEGSVMCAKCALEKAADCQDVLIVADGDAKAEYWIVKNDVSEKFGHACQSEKPAKVTGTVSEQDGQSWITAQTMEAPAS